MTEPQTPAETGHTPSPDRNRRIMAGAVLVVAGLGLLALQAFEGLGDEGILFFIGTLFVVGYFLRRTYGLLVAGCIILGVGLGQTGERLIDTSGDVTVIGIGIGFALIFVIDRLSKGDSHWWPLIPAGILLLIGLSQIGGSFADVASLLWPALLIVAGVVLLFGAMRRRD